MVRPIRYLARAQYGVQRDQRKREVVSGVVQRKADAARSRRVADSAKERVSEIKKAVSEVLRQARGAVARALNAEQLGDRDVGAARGRNLRRRRRTASHAFSVWSGSFDQRRRGLRAARASSKRPRRVRCGAPLTNSGDSSAS